MRTQLRAEELDLYRRNGFLPVPDFLDPDELETLRNAVDEAVAAMGKKKVTGELDWQEGEDYYDRVFTQRLNLWRISEPVRKFIMNPELGQMMAQMEEIDGIRVWHDQALIKEPYGNPTGWHLDDPYWSFDSPHAITIWVALDDATVENGCLWFIPGSHRMPVRYEAPSIGENIGELFDVYPFLRDVDPVPAPLPAGGASFHNGLTAHGAGANMTRGRRRALTCAYMPDGSTFNGKPNILPPSYLEQISVGERLNSAEHNPLVWRRN